MITHHLAVFVSRATVLFKQTYQSKLENAFSEKVIAAAESLL